MNPTGQPFGAPPPGAPPAGPDARGAVNVPGILLIVTGALGLLFALWGLVSGGVNAEQMAQLNQAMSDPNFPPALKGVVQNMSSIGRVGSIISLLVYGLVLFGGVQARNLKMYPLAIAASFAAMLPCQCACCIGIPVGIYALVVLFKPEVKSAFS
ncbi:MAG: hypothetical protein AMXMBFR34_16610 [Myxococcaceae bacterium]